MGMTVGTPGKAKTPVPAMNVTPLVDVVLVLLIIFMVISPLMAKNFWVHLPKQEKQELDEPPPADAEPPLVLQVARDHTITVNNQPIAEGELVERLKRMFAARSDHVLFFDADDAADYGFTMAVLDKAREGHAVTIAPLTRQLGAPPAGTPAAPADPPAP